MIFCPDGYMPVQEAIKRSAQYWFSERVAALEAAMADELANSKDECNSSSIQQVARALSGQPSISERLRQEFAGVLTETEHRLRNFLHQGLLSAYYFGGLADQGRCGVKREFWATTKADGVLLSGTYFPFGKPGAWHEKRPSHPLFFLQSELEALLSDDPKSCVRKSHLTNAVCDDADNSHENLSATIPKTEAENSAHNRGRADKISSPNRRRSQPAFERARRVIKELYPNGVPDQATESNKKLCKRVSEKLKETEAVSADTILRAAGRRK
jgi:hypothetical protein